ncbi:uncharacterized protein LOC128958902 [Oppia nitens]|uniref:uncharacterized protein LOC128958902 n=1 Tax=Oppia nitens TaxID=1686743 RepID=UPI0023DAC63D|nr:uncharacterized protein LOC128958902 [Oppia nitens]
MSKCVKKFKCPLKTPQKRPAKEDKSETSDEVPISDQLISSKTVKTKDNKAFVFMAANGKEMSISVKTIKSVANVLNQNLEDKTRVMLSDMTADSVQLVPQHCGDKQQSDTDNCDQRLDVNESTDEPNDWTDDNEFEEFVDKQILQTKKRSFEPMICLQNDKRFKRNES